MAGATPKSLELRGISRRGTPVSAESYGFMALHPMTPSRAVFTVTRVDGGWAVEHGGEHFDHCRTREEATASATRRANVSQNAGPPSKIVFADEPAFYRS